MDRYRTHQGALDPVSLIVNVSPSDVVPDLSLVTNAEIRSVDATGIERSWAVTIKDQSPTALQLIHPYQQVDTAALRTLTQWVRLTVTGAANPIDTVAWELTVTHR